MAKWPDFGGVPLGMLNEIVGLVSGVLPPGFDQEDANNVLVHLVWEEHQASNPGPGGAGFYEVLEALDELKSAKEQLRTATNAAEFQAAVAALIAAIDALTRLWKIGSPAQGLYTWKS